jgi:uncharacterized membrane protein
LVSAAALYDWLVFVHILAAMVWVGGAVLLAVMVTRSCARTTSAQ